MSNYTDWVRSLPCCVTGTIDMAQVDPHHIKGYSWLTGSGVGYRGDDLLAIPLRSDLHRELHQIGVAEWELKHNRRQLEECLRTIMRAIQEGVITITL